MPPIMAKLNAILKPEYVNNFEFLHSFEIELNAMAILPLISIFCSAITRPIL